MTTINCISNDSFAACSGVSGLQINKGLQVDINGSLTLIFYPYSLFQDGVNFVFSDATGNWVKVDSSDTPYLNATGVLERVKSCSYDGLQIFENTTAPTITVTNFTLPTTEINKKLMVTLNGVQVFHPTDFTISNQIITPLLDGQVSDYRNDHIAVRLKNYE